MASSDVLWNLTAILSANVKGYGRLMGNKHHATVKTPAEYRGVSPSCIQQFQSRVVDARPTGPP